MKNSIIVLAAAAAGLGGLVAFNHSSKPEAAATPAAPVAAKPVIGKNGKRETAPHTFQTFQLTEEELALGKKSLVMATMDDEELVKLKDRTIKQLESRDWTSLETNMSSLLKSQEKTSSGDWSLVTAYNAVAELTEGAPETEWIRRRDLLKAWTAMHPESHHASISLGRFYKSYAWHARGTGYASTVTDSAHMIFRERLRLSMAELNRMPDTNNPIWYSSVLRLLIPMGHRPEVAEKFFAQAVNAWPDYYALYSSRLGHILPRWSGKDKSVELDFLKQSADALGGDKGDELYAILAIDIDDYDDWEHFIQSPKCDWSRVKRGLKSLAKNNPGIWADSQISIYAGNRCDDAEAKAAFDRLNGRMLVTIWTNKNNVAIYLKWRAYFDARVEWDNNRAHPQGR